MTLGIRHKTPFALVWVLSILCVAACGVTPQPTSITVLAPTPIPTPLPTPCPAQLCDAPTPVLEARDDCSVDPGIPTNYEVAFTGSKPGRILFEVDMNFSTGEAPYDVGKEEVWAVDENGDNLTNLTRVNGTTPTGLTADSRSKLTSSPDGLQLAFVVSDGILSPQLQRMYVMDTYGNDLTQLTFRDPEEFTRIDSFTWSADNAHLAFTVSHWTSGPSNSYLIKADGSDVQQLLDIPWKKPLDAGFDLGSVSHNQWLAFSNADNYVAFSSISKGKYKGQLAASRFIGVQNRMDEEIFWKLNGVSDQDLKWSPNDEMIAFETGGDVYVVQSDGSCHLNVTALIEDRFGKNPFELTHLMSRGFVKFVWSHDSQKLAIVNKTSLFVVNIGSPGIHVLDLRSIFKPKVPGNTLPQPRFDFDQPPLVKTTLNNLWAKDNQRLLLSKRVSLLHGGEEVVLVDVTSGETQQLFQGSGMLAGDASWSPDGSKIVFVRYSFGDKNQIMIMNSDGSELRPITPEMDLQLSSPIWIRQSPE